MGTAAPLCLLFAVATTLFCVSSACSVYYPCLCEHTTSIFCKLPLSGIVCGNETLVYSGLRVDCFNTSIIRNDAFKTLPCKDCLCDIYLDNNNISVIEPDAFRGLQHLEVAVINNNEIRELRHSTFQHNPELRRLDVSVNRLGFLHPDMFIHTKLYFLNVSFNMLVLNGTLLNSKYLNILDAAYCTRKRDNSWNVLDSTTFIGLPSLTKLVLEGNGIRSLSSDIFMHNPRLVELNLRNNALRAISHEIFRHTRHIGHLHLSYNPLVCDCGMKMFSVWCYNHSVKLDDVLCETPRANWKLLETLSCDTVSSSYTFMPVTDSTNATMSVSVSEIIASTNTDSSTESISESDIAKSTVSGSTSVKAMPYSMYTHQYETVSKNGSSISSVAQSDMNFTKQIPHNYTRSSNLTLAKAVPIRFFSWYVYASICSLIISVVLVIIVVVVLIKKLSRREDLEGSMNCLHYFTFCSHDRRTYVEANENCHRRTYINYDNLQTPLPQETELHYLNRGVTSLTDVKPRMRPRRSQEVTMRKCSGSVETNTDTLITTEGHEGHVYEVII